MKKNAIALLITTIFIMLITVGIGVGLKYLNTSIKEAKNESLMIQSSVILEDILKILKNDNKLKATIRDNTGQKLGIFLESWRDNPPIEIAGLKIFIEIQSARAKINLNNLDSDLPIHKKIKQRLKLYLIKNGVSETYLLYLNDSVKPQVDSDINIDTNIFRENPSLPRGLIASREQLEVINQFYKLIYHDNSLDTIPFDDIFYFTKDDNTSLDLCQIRSPAMLEIFKDFADSDTFCTNPQYFIFINMEIQKNSKNSNISFEYDINSSRGYNFRYEI